VTIEMLALFGSGKGCVIRAARDCGWCVGAVTMRDTSFEGLQERIDRTVVVFDLLEK
jgi:hypothetical protein